MALVLDRMEIEEVGYNSSRLAAAIHSQVDCNIGPVDVHKIARALDIVEIVTKPLTTFEGGLLTQAERTNGSILVNALASRNRQRFTVAHELLHFLNDKHVQTVDMFKCRASDIRQTGLKVKPGMTRHQHQEVEANRFAVELLAPRTRFNTVLKQTANLNAVLDIAKDLNISKETTARRYVDLYPGPIAILLQKDQRLRYGLYNDDFPQLLISRGDKVPALPQAPANSTLSDIETTDPEDWFRRPYGKEVSAQTLYQQDGYSMTLLILDQAADEDDEHIGIEDAFERYNRWNS